MRGLAPLLMIVIAMAATETFAADNDPLNFGQLPQTTVQKIDPPTITSKPPAEVGATFEDSQRLAAIERRLAAVEAKAISAAEAREIAEQVVDERIKQLRLAISTPDGGQRVATAKFNTYGDTVAIKLNPGEILTSYTDANGNVVRVNQPTPSAASSAPVQWSTSDVRFSMPAPSATMPQTVNVQPVRRGLFGRARSWQPAASTCRMVNVGGRMMRICN